MTLLSFIHTHVWKSINSLKGGMSKIGSEKLPPSAIFQSFRSYINEKNKQCFEQNNANYTALLHISCMYYLIL